MCPRPVSRTTLPSRKYGAPTTGSIKTGEGGACGAASGEAPSLNASVSGGRATLLGEVSDADELQNLLHEAYVGVAVHSDLALFGSV